jgi:hypothetical protein
MWKNLSLISRISLEQKQTAISSARRGQTLSKWEKGKVKKLPSKLSEWVVILAGQLLLAETWTRARRKMLFLSLFYCNHRRRVSTVVIHFALCAIQDIFQFGDPEKWQSESETLRAAQMKWRCVVCRCIYREKENTTHVTQLLFVLSISTREVYYAMHSPVSPWLRKSLEHQNL